MITDQSQWKEPLVARDGTRTVQVVEVDGPDYEGDYLVTFAEDLTDLDGDLTKQAWFMPNGTTFLWNRNITISPAAEGAGNICGGDAPDETAALREEVARLREHISKWVRYMGDESDELGDAQFEHDWMMESRRIATLESTDQ